ncbi:hypothetical protein [Psychrobacter alimentarius]|uniref:hypothetical protein n=1 Tax=Psychrobacter alimentarius TaxID=261164 RepID=UPI001919B277|nr:hypothetical protein [Psychrobacter alimentarius]
MSDDPIKIVAKLDDDKDYSLAPFIEYFIDCGFHVTACKFKKENLPKALQSKLIVGDNLFYVLEMPGMLSEYFFLENSGESYAFNTDNYNNIYLPNKDNVELEVFPEDGCINAYHSIEISDPNNESIGYEFRIGLLDSFLFGRLLIITIMYRGSKKLVKTLGYDEEESIATPLYPIIFKHFNPQKMLYMSLSGYREDFYDFFGEDNKDVYRDKFASRMTEDPVFMTDYYNKGWRYQDYIDTGILYRFFDFSHYQILLYQKYADNFNCPQEELDKAWAWYRENDQRFLE